MSDMKRREFIALIGGIAAAWPLAARAQQGERLRRVGVLTALAESDSGWRRNFAGFIAGLREAGWTEGQNFRFEFRYVPGGSVDPLRSGGNRACCAAARCNPSRDFRCGASRSATNAINSHRIFL